MFFKIFSILFLIFILNFAEAFSLRKNREVIINGKFLCLGHSANHIQVELVYKNKRLFNKICALQKSETDSDGCFETHGSRKTIFTLNTFLKITHRCQEDNIMCHRVIFLKNPKATTPRRSNQIVKANLGVQELASLNNYKRVCLPQKSIRRKNV